MAEAGSKRRRRTSPGPGRQGGGLFGWTIAILLLIGLAFASWIGSYYIFGHPEKAFSYAVLTRLKKLEPPKRFELTAAPRGEFLGPEKLMERYGAMTPRELERASEAMLRAYLRNFRLAPELVPYVIGDYSILDSHELTGANFFEEGVVVLAQSKERPEVLLEHIFPADPKVVPVLHRTLLTGLDLQLNRGLDLSALVNVKRLADGRMQFTAVPLLYGNYATTGGPGMFSLEPPRELNIAAGLPVLGMAAVEEATRKYTAYLERAGLPASPLSAPPRPPSQLVRIERPQPVHTPAPPVAATPTPTPEPPPSPPPMFAEVVPQSTPPPPAPSPTPAPTPGAVASTAGGSWPVYSPGQMPRGRLLNIQDMTELSSRGVGGERIYLQGSFVVTASGGNRAVLRAQTALAETLGLRGRTSNIRVIAEFPSGAKPPSEGSTLARDSMRPFQITDVRTGSDGQVNVFVREVTR